MRMTIKTTRKDFTKLSNFALFHCADFECRSSQQLMLTKGDNNHIDDTVMYSGNQGFLDRRQVLGFVRGYVPFIGWVVIALQEFARLPELAYHVISGYWLGLTRLCI